MPRILIAYASAKGSTERIARKVGERCAAAGPETKIVSTEEDPGYQLFDAVILGSAIHNMDWLPSARTVVERLGASGPPPPVWAFSVSTWGAMSTLLADWLTRRIRRTTTEPKTVMLLRTVSDVRDPRQFAGVIRRGDWPRFGRIVFALMGGKYGDARDWSDIERWADTIVGELLEGVSDAR